MDKIFGIGIDIVDINKFKNKHYKDNKKFYQKIFVNSEIEYCLKFKNSGQHFAGKFAIKEAVRKSLKKSIDFLDIITEHEDSKPIIKLKIKNNYNFFVSISHDKNYAIAIVIIQ
tara:strand:- start:932 stop:1273 length:342 start_codon:yes stop_codon:yes gene_type:complete